MALHPCRECGQQVSTEATACPHCGVPQPVEKPEDLAPRVRQETGVSESSAEWALWVKKQFQANRRRENILEHLQQNGIPHAEAMALVDALGAEYGRPFNVGSRATSRASETSEEPHVRLMGLAGAGLLFLGVFLPILRVPIVGSLNYFRNGQGDGVVVLVLAVITVVAVIQDNYKWLWGTGLGAFAMLTFTFVNFQVKMSSARSDMERELADNPFAGLGTAMIESVQLEWGWVVLVTGAALVTAAAWRANLE